MPKKSVLILDQDPIRQETLQGQLKNQGYWFLSAVTIEGALILFGINPNLDAIIIDSCVAGNPLRTVLFAKRMRRLFGGLIIAISDDLKIRRLFTRVGCDYVIKESEVPEKLKEVLLIESTQTQSP